MADPTSKRFDIEFNAQLDATHKAMLSQLAQKKNRKMSQVVRELIDGAYRMEFGAEPRCSSGMGCLCPQVHALQRATNVSSAELVAQQMVKNGAA